MLLATMIAAVFLTESAAERKTDDVYAARLTAEESETVVLGAPSGSGIEHNEYRIIVSSDSFMVDMDFAVEFSDYLRKLGTLIRYSIDTRAEDDFEILFGNTNRALSKELVDLCKTSTANDELVWGYMFRDGKLAFAANSDEAFTRGTKEFKELFFPEDGVFTVPSDLMKLSVLSRAEYDEEVRIENERLEAEKEAERLKYIEELKALISGFELSQFGDVSLDTSMPASPYGKPNLYPNAGEHPRLNVTSYMIPLINEFFDRYEAKYLKEKFYAFANSDYTGILPPAKEVTEGRKGFHNVDESGLMKIEARALAYLLTGDEKYGYEAIYAIKNYLTTLDLRQIYSDQCREFGRTIMCAAEVYDWCYDLLSDADKEQLILGITDICAGTNEMGRQMEVGYPPLGQGSVSGHGSERQILRDYFSVAVAIYDEDPSWYEFVAGRIYNEYVPFRNHYYQSGTYPQGVNLYAAGRHSADTWSAWIMLTSVGETAYDPALRNIVKSFYAYELPDGTFFGTGDSGRNSGSTRFNTCAYLMMGLFEDDYLYSWIYKNTSALKRISASNLEMSYSHMAILLSNYFSDPNNTVEPISRYDGVSVISYNGYPIGQMITRYDWQNGAAAATFMKIGERTTANHEHGDAGTFQIFYKGLYTGESGLYDKYGSTHFTFYHQATVAHNGLLVYNANLYGSETDSEGVPVNNKRYWYSGSQRDPGESGDLWEWLNDDVYDTGSVTDVEYGINEDATADYAYLAGDITAAYDKQTVDYVGRRMFTLYTGNEEFPMYFIVYDAITSDSEEYEKRFLLQTPTEPEIDEVAKTVTIKDKEGKLVLTSLVGAERFDALGGTDRTFLINGVNCEAIGGSDGNNWGRVEIAAPTGEKMTEMLNFMYVTDIGNENKTVPTLIENDKIVGTRVENTVVLFAKDLDPSCESFNFTTEGSGLVRHFITGVHGGTWHVTVDGVSVATVTASDEGHLLDFYAPCGNVTVRPGSDVPPANGGRIIYNVFGGLVPDDAPLTFEIGVPVTLPTNIVRGSDIFIGWYSHPSLADEYLITEVNATEKGRYNVYAKYKAFPVNENYESSVVNHEVSSKTVNKISYNGSGKAGSKFETITENGNSYLRITKGTSDPAVNVSNAIPDYIGVDTKLTIRIDLAKEADTPIFASNCRLRASSSADTISIFKTSVDGSVLLMGKTKVMTLTESFQTLAITIDFEAGTMTAYEKYGKEIATSTFSPPTVSGLTATSEWMGTLVSTFNWYMSGADGTLLVDNLYVYVGDFVPDVEIIPEGMGKIIYNTGGNPLPSDAPIYYEMGTVTELPILTSNVDEFIGWYTSPSFEKETLISAIPEDAEGEFEIFARWRGIYIKEDFEDVGEITFTEEMGTFGQIGLNAGTSKVGASARTETDENGNTYLVFIRGENDPALYVSGGIGDFATPAHALTVELSMALVPGMSAANIAYRIRAKIDGKNTHLIPFAVALDGKVLLGGKSDYVITELTEEFQTVAVTVNWDTSTFTAYLDGVKVKEMKADLSVCNLEWLSSVTGALNFYSSKSGEALKFDNFLAYTDVYPDKGLVAPEGKGAITYEAGGATLPSDAPIYFDKNGGTVLPVPVKDRDEFLGWYTDPEFSEDSKISVIPATENDSITVYARWRGIYINEDFEDVGEISYTEESGMFGQVGLSSSAGKVGSSARTETDENGNTYLVFIRGENDPALYVSGGIGDFATPAHALTVELSMALVPGMSAANIAYRIRAKIDGKNTHLIPFAVALDGKVLLGGKSDYVITELTEEFQTVAVTVNWDTSTFTAYLDGVKVQEIEVDLSYNNLEWLSSVTSAMNFWSNSGGEALKFDNFLAYTDVYPDKGLVAPEGKGAITYEAGDATLPSDAPIYFDKNGGTVLPVPVKDRDEFLGWYTDPEFSEDSKISVIPATEDDSITVYARWRGIFINQNFDSAADAEYVATSGKIAGVSFNPKAGASFKTATDDSGNKYVVLEINNESAVDPHLGMSGSIPAFSTKNKALTLEASLSLKEGASALACSYRLRSRVDGKKLDLYLFTVAKDGRVLLGQNGAAICTLSSEEFTDIAVSVNWDTGLLTGYVNGTPVASAEFDTQTRGLDWLAGVSNIMYFYAYGSEGAIMIDDLFAYTDEYSAK